MNNQLVRTRMAPSPTGEMHVGGMAMVLKNYAWAKKNGGQFVLRIEDTDKEREVTGSIEEIQQVIQAYGLDWDEGPGKEGAYGPYIQSERLELYQQHAQQLVELDQAYPCFCSKERLEQLREESRKNHQPPKYDQHCRKLSQAEAAQRIAKGESYVIRLKVPADYDVTFMDLLRGEISINTNEIDDQVLLKSDGFPTYHLAVVVDDHLMKISHILRGEEWISSAPKHVLLYEAFGWEKPVFAHMPIFLNPDGKGKMSKRKGVVSAKSFLDRGYLPEAMLNFFMILGWAKEDQQEIMTLDQYVAEFDPKDMSAKSVVFDIQKLDWLNGVYIRQLTSEELTSRLKPFLPADFPQEKLAPMLALVRERLVTLAEIEPLTAFFYREIELDRDLLLKKADQQLVAKQLQMTKEALSAVSDWSDQNLEQLIRDLQENNDWHRGQYFMMLRLMATGKKATPPLFETLAVLGQPLTINRLDQALELIK